MNDFTSSVQHLQNKIKPRIDPAKLESISWMFILFFSYWRLAVKLWPNFKDKSFSLIYSKIQYVNVCRITNAYPFISNWNRGWISFSNILDTILLKLPCYLQEAPVSELFMMSRGLCRNKPIVDAGEFVLQNFLSTGLKTGPLPVPKGSETGTRQTHSGARVYIEGVGAVAV